MKLKAFKIWLFLLPLVGLIGILLFVQSSNNLEELEQQHTRSVAGLSKNVQVALPDYLKRVNAHLLREGFLKSKDEDLVKNARKVLGILSGFEPEVYNFRKTAKDNLPEVSYILDSTRLKVLNLPAEIPKLAGAKFQDTGSDKLDLRVQDSDNSALLFDLNIPIRDLVGKQISNDLIFEKFYLTNSKGTIIYPDESIGKSLFKPEVIQKDTSGVTHAGILSSMIILDGNRYKAYSSPIFLGPNRLHLVALYDLDYFQNIALRINYNLLSNLILILILLLASIPILAVVNMGRGDQMTQSRIIHVGISLMTIAVVMGFSFSFTKNRPNPDQILQGEMALSAKQLEENLSTFKSPSQFWIDKESVPKIPELTNEIIQIDYETGFVKQIYYNLRRTIEPLHIDFGGKASFIYLGEREYYTYFKRSQKKSTFLNSHYSRGTGQLETVIAYQDPISPKSNINAVTFPLELDSTLNEKYRILLVKEDGKVLFKSKKVISSIGSLRESISPEKWKEVSSLLKNNSSIPEEKSLHVPLYLNGNQYDAVFNRIESKEYDQALWQVFLVNTNLFHAFSALTSLEGMIFLAIYFAFLLFTLFAQLYTRTSANSKGFKSFLFEWLVPNEKNVPRLNYLILSYGVLTWVLFKVLQSVSLNPFSTLALMIFTSLSVSVVNLVSAQVMELIERRRFSTELAVLFLLFFSIFLLIRNIFPELKSGTLHLTLATLGIALVWAIIAIRKIPFSHLHLFRSSKNLQSAYLLFWFFLIGFLPGYLIQSKTQQFESTVWNGTNQSELPISFSLNEYEKVRRNLMTTIGDPFDLKIQDFMAPDQKVLRYAWEGVPTRLSSSPSVFLAFGLLVFLTFLVIRWIQNSIFFDLKPDPEEKLDSEIQFNYICCINSHQIPEPSANTVTIDLKFQSFSEDFISPAKNYRFINFHCMENPMDLLHEISRIKKIGNSVAVFSGELWKNIYSRLKNDHERSVFSEVFSDFKFGVIPINDVEIGPFKSEQEVSSALKRHKAFYSNIWSELNFEEKLVCASFAKEGFFNPARKDTLLDLAQKGIALPKATVQNSGNWQEWRLFSPIFRQYILNHFTEDDEVRFKEYEKKHGNVKTIQTAMISFVLICIALVGIFDKTIFNQAYAYLTGGLGILGTLYSVLNQGFAGFIS